MIINEIFIIIFNFKLKLIISFIYIKIRSKNKDFRSIIGIKQLLLKY